MQMGSWRTTGAKNHVCSQIERAPEWERETGVEMVTEVHAVCDHESAPRDRELISLKYQEVSI